MSTHGKPPIVTRPNGLDGIDRAIALYLLLPILLFCTWLRPSLQLMCLGLAIFGAWRSLTATGSRPGNVTARWWCALILVSLAWTAISGAGHIFYSNKDWLIRDSVLHDLSISDWPLVYDPGEGHASLLLRAPLGYYLPAASIGRLLGNEAADWALYAWTSAGFALVLAGSVSLFDGLRQRIAAIGLMMLFGGLDLLGYVWGERHLPQLGEHLEWWMGYIQYSSNSTLLYWVPNHALPAWLGTILILRHWKSRELATLTPLLAAAIPLWSPLAAIGLFPLFLFGLDWKRDAASLFSIRTSLPFLPIAFTIVLYLSADASSVPHGWMIENSTSIVEFAYRYLLFCLLEFGFLALIIAKMQAVSAPLKVSIAALLALPFVYYGGGNDLAMRASIPALMVLALSTVHPLTDQGGGPWRALLVLVIGLGMYGALQEAMRSLTSPAWKPMHSSLPEAVKMWDPGIANPYPSHYCARMGGRLDLLFDDPKTTRQRE